MKKQNCNDICELLSSYLDNALNAEEKKKIEAHLSSCDYCSYEYRTLLEMKKVMEAIKDEEIPAPEGFVKNVMEQIEKDNVAPTAETSHKTTGVMASFVDKIMKKPWIPVMIAAVFLVVLYVPGQIGPMFFNDQTQQSADGMKMTFTEEMAPEPGMDRATPSDMNNLNIAPTFSSDEFEDGEGLIDTQRKIIRNASMSMEVINYTEAEAVITQQAEALGGFISNSNSYYYGVDQDLLVGSISLRVPEEHFNQMINYIEETGRQTDKNTWTNDVTEMYLDMETRIRNLEIKEERLLAILGQQGSLQDLLAVENEIAQTRSEIERLTGRLNLLKNQVAFSTIEVNLREVKSLDQTISGEGFSGLGTKMRESLIRSINLVIDYSVKALLVLTGSLPFLLILSILGFGSYRIWKKRKKVE